MYMRRVIAIIVRNKISNNNNSPAIPRSRQSQGVPGTMFAIGEFPDDVMRLLACGIWQQFYVGHISKHGQYRHAHICVYILSLLYT